jgi:hypothetical protein
MTNQNRYAGPVLVGVAEAAKITGKSAYSLRQDIAESRIAFVRSGKRILVHMPLLLEQIEQEATRGVVYVQ